MVSGAVFEITKKNNAGEVEDVRFVEVNAAFETLTGLGRDQVVGKALRQFWPDTEQIWFDQADIALREGPSEIDFHRNHIRRKLRLGRRTNLQSYLNSLGT